MARAKLHTEEKSSPARYAARGRVRPHAAIAKPHAAGARSILPSPSATSPAVGGENLPSRGKRKTAKPPGRAAQNKRPPNPTEQPGKAPHRNHHQLQANISTNSSTNLFMSQISETRMITRTLFARYEIIPAYATFPQTPHQ